MGGWPRFYFRPEPSEWPEILFDFRPAPDEWSWYYFDLSRVNGQYCDICELGKKNYGILWIGQQHRLDFDAHIIWKRLFLMGAYIER